MANPSPKAVAEIRARVADWSPSNAEIATILNTPDRPNPIPAVNVPKPMRTVDLLSKIDGPAKGKIYGRPAILGLQADIKSGDRNAVKNWFGLAATSGDISPTQYAALVAEVDATIPDPSWNHQVSWAVVTLGRPVDLDDIAASRPGV